MNIELRNVEIAMPTPVNIWQTDRCFRKEEEMRRSRPAANAMHSRRCAEYV
jgi:O-phosphoseryl-tRNA(Cys) synthetase